MRPMIDVAALIQADIRVIPLSDEIADCVVTSPPYWAMRDYGCAGQLGLEPSPEAYIESLAAVFSEVRRILKPSGTLWVVIDDTYASNWGHGAKRASSWWSTKSGAARGKGRGKVATVMPPNHRNKQQPTKVRLTYANDIQRSAPDPTRRVGGNRAQHDRI